MPSNLITPNMFLTEPAIGNSLSPQWAQLLNADMGIIDQHNHSPGSGVQVPPDGLDINSDLTFQGNNLLALNSAVFNGAISGSPFNLSIYSNGTDLFFTDINGNAIQLTKNGGPNTSAGNIQGLPSTPTGGAGISWINAQSTFNFSDDSGTGQASIDVASIIIRYPGSYPTPTGNYILLEAPSSLATGYTLTLPPALQPDTGILQVNSSGVITNNIKTINANYPGTGTSFDFNNGFTSISAPTTGVRVLAWPAFGASTNNAPVINVTVNAGTTDIISVVATSVSSSGCTVSIHANGSPSNANGFSITVTGTTN